MTGIDLDFDLAPLLAATRALSEAYPEAVRHAIVDAVSATEQHAKSTRLFKDITGDTRRSIGSAVDGFSGRVFAFSKIARFLENGTRPHVITARNGGVLSFIQNGTRRFARSVNHPGTAPRPFMHEAGDHGEIVLDYAVDNYVDAAVARFSAAA